MRRHVDAADARQLRARSSSATASTGACIGTIASPTKRFGYFRCAAAHASLNTCESFNPNSGGAQYTIGLVSDSACMSTRPSSMSFKRVAMSTYGDRELRPQPEPGATISTRPLRCA